MNDFKNQYELWDEFLRIWPPDRLAQMTLDEYTQAGERESFTNWIESRLGKLGSIWGGSAFKFGVYSRGKTDKKENDSTRSYSDTHGWYSSLGATAEEVFEKVRGFVVQVTQLAAKGDLDGIEKFEHLGEAYKWKIAFHYQDRNTPQIVNIFSKGMLNAFADTDVAGHSMAALQRAALARRPDGMGILEFGHQIWSEWSKQNLIWKLSHGDKEFSDEERQRYLHERLAVMYGKTAPNQGKKFSEAPVDTLFYLCHGNSPQLIGRFTSAAVHCPTKEDGWLQRSYCALKTAIRSDAYQASQKKWSPRGISTFWQVGKEELREFQETLLLPYFKTDLAELAGMEGDPIEAASAEGTAGENLPGEEQRPSTRRPPFNRIYYGPPGTGKTYTLQEVLKKDYTDGVTKEKRYAFVTFHQSYGYEEFVEGLRPVLGDDTASGQVRYELRPGVFADSEESCQSFQRKVATCSTAKLPVIGAQRRWSFCLTPSRGSGQGAIVVCASILLSG